MTTFSDPASEPTHGRKLHPVPRGLVELYGLLAVLFVLVPEWMATGLLQGWEGHREGADLPPAAAAWKRFPELRLATMTLAEQRQLARSVGLWGYANESRERLTARLLGRLKRRKAL